MLPGTGQPDECIGKPGVTTGPASTHRGRNILSVRLSEGEARTRFATVPVARLGTADARGRPHVVVVTFAVQGDTVYTAVDQKPKSGTNLKRLRNVAENPWVAMLADEYSDDWDTLWWARADGQAAVLCGPQQMAEPLRLLADRYWQYREAPPRPGAGGDGRAMVGLGRHARVTPRRLLLLGTPAAIEVHEFLAHLRAQVLGFQPAGEPDGLPHLGQVLGAVRAAGQMALEAAPARPGQRTFQVIGDQLDGLLAGEVTARGGVSSHLPELVLDQLAERSGRGAAEPAGCRH